MWNEAILDTCWKPIWPTHLPHLVPDRHLSVLLILEVGCFITDITQKKKNQKKEKIKSFNLNEKFCLAASGVCMCIWGSFFLVFFKHFFFVLFVSGLKY